MKILEFIYNERSISFDPVSDENVMVNATQMAKIFDKDVRLFLKADHVNSFIETLLMTPYGINKSFLKREEIVLTNKKGGTWMHRILALKFAAWLDPKFEVWVWNTIDHILLGHYREVKVAVYEKIQAEKAVSDKREMLLANNPEFIEFLELEGKVTEAEKKRQKAIRESMAQFKIEFSAG